MAMEFISVSKIWADFDKSDNLNLGNMGTNYRNVVIFLSKSISIDELFFRNVHFFVKACEIIICR